jgi:hypothetical protein
VQACCAYEHGGVEACKSDDVYATCRHEGIKAWRSRGWRVVVVQVCVDIEVESMEACRCSDVQVWTRVGVCTHIWVMEVLRRAEMQKCKCRGL